MRRRRQARAIESRPQLAPRKLLVTSTWSSRRLSRPSMCHGLPINASQNRPSRTTSRTSKKGARAWNSSHRLSKPENRRTKTQAKTATTKSRKTLLLLCVQNISLCQRSISRKEVFSETQSARLSSDCLTSAKAYLQERMKQAISRLQTSSVRLGQTMT